MERCRYLEKKKLITPPGFLIGSVQYETIMGSVAYGVSSDTSDMDIYGFCIPPKDMLFPHLRGEIPGFGRQINRFEQFQQHHIYDKESDKLYDISIYSIIKYFQLCMENNPNMIDSLFTPQRCVLHITKIGEHIRENRKIFLHSGCWHKFKGYAFSQLHKAQNELTPQQATEFRYPA
jgi:predicted nucleotidyltransferase